MQLAKCSSEAIYFRYAVPPSTVYLLVAVAAAEGYLAEAVAILPFGPLDRLCCELNPRPAGVFSRTRPAGGGGGADSAPLPNSRTNRRSEAGEAAIESPEREDSNAH